MIGTPARPRARFELEHQAACTLAQSEPGTSDVEGTAGFGIHRAQRAEAREGQLTQAVDAAREHAARAPREQPGRAESDRHRATRTSTAHGRRRAHVPERASESFDRHREREIQQAARVMRVDATG